jgi:hypothetical protein
VKQIIVWGVFVLTGLAGQAMADCSGPSLNQVQLQNTLSGMTVCATRGDEKWQEQHQGSGGGALVDYKKGPSDPVDPSKEVGSWNISGTGTNAVVNYNYSGGGTYSYAVLDNKDGTYSFCGNGTGEEIVATIVPAGPCP